MENINKIISFILGLIVVVVFIAIVSGKFKIGSGLKKIAKIKVSPAVTKKPTPIPTEAVTVSYNNSKQAPKVVVAPKTTPKPNTNTPVNQYQTTNSPAQISGNNISSIPNTGAPTLLIPSALSMLAAGTFLKRSTRKK
ncbi:MAG: hypothetical protein ABIO02_01335 [Patescibacteria group bacterium]